MYTQPDQALLAAATLTFEELGFLFAAPELGEEQKDLLTQETTAVAFRGSSVAGDLVLKINTELLSIIAANMLGDDEPLAPETQRDALGEIANVICGNALPEIFGKQEIFRLGAPQHFYSPTNEKPAAAVRVNLDEGCADVLLYLNNS